MCIIIYNMNYNIKELVANGIWRRKAQGLPVNTTTYTRNVAKSLSAFRAKHIRSTTRLPAHRRKLPPHLSLWNPKIENSNDGHIYSQVFIGKVTSKLQKWMRQLQWHGPYVKTPRLPDVGTSIVLKIQTYDRQDPWKDFINRCQNEVRIQARLNEPTSPARPYVPKVYLGGLVANTYTFVTIMKTVPGVALGDVPTHQRQIWKRPVLTAYRALRKAGVHHGDLTVENILVDKRTGKVYFIDFGSAVNYGQGRSKPSSGYLKAVTYAQGQQFSNNAQQMLILFGGYQNLFKNGIPRSRLSNQYTA
jgi:serine/threonine protein kinase